MPKEVSVATAEPGSSASTLAYRARSSLDSRTRRRQTRACRGAAHEGGPVVVDAVVDPRGLALPSHVHLTWSLGMGNPASKSSDSASLRRRASSWRTQKNADESRCKSRSRPIHRRASAKLPFHAWATARQTQSPGDSAAGVTLSEAAEESPSLAFVPLAPMVFRPQDLELDQPNHPI